MNLNRDTSKSLNESVIEITSNSHFLTEEQYTNLTENYINYLLESNSAEKIANMTDDELTEGLLDFMAGLKPMYNSIQQKGAETRFRGELETLNKGKGEKDVKSGHHLQQLAALRSTNPEGSLNKALAKSYDKSVQDRSNTLGGKIKSAFMGRFTQKSREDATRKQDDERLAKLGKMPELSGEKLAGRYEEGMKSMVAKKLEFHRAEAARLQKMLDAARDVNTAKKNAAGTASEKPATTGKPRNTRGKVK